MNMALFDWLIVGGLFVAVAAIAMYTKRYTRSVAGFLSANRCAGRYMLTMAESMSAMSALAIVATFEMIYQAGFAAIWWLYMMIPVGLFINLSGWITYRFRQTRALTLAQFFEIRYSKKFRVFAGAVCWFSGILNYGIFPGVTARLLVHLCGLPQSFELFGLAVPMFPVVMFFMLSVAVMLAISGGQIALMVTDFLQSQFTQITLIVIMFLFLFKFGWADIIQGLQAAPEGKSMLDPFKQGDIPDFNFWYFVMLAIIGLYAHRCWQGGQGYYSSAKNAHEAKMAGILAGLRGSTANFLMFFIPITAFVFMHHADYTQQTDVVRSSLAAISDSQVQTQMTVPLALTQMLPVGVFGMFVTVAITAAISTDDSYLHSWGSIFVQDVLTPFRKKKLTPKQHLLWLRLSIISVAVFSFFFSLFFQLKDFIYMYWQLTGAIFVGGAGCAIIGGLYWKRGTTLGAWCGMITGSVLAFSGAIIQSIWADVPALSAIAPEFPLNGIQLSFISSGCAIAMYVITSLISGKKPFNMDRMLHRGKYAVESDHTQMRKVSLISRLFGMGKEFTIGDKVIYITAFVWANIWFVPFVVVTVIALTYGLPEKFWPGWWCFAVLLMAASGIIITVWFLIGGIKNLIELFQTLKIVQENEADDGTVVGHHSLVDETLAVLDDGDEAE